MITISDIKKNPLGYWFTGNPENAQVLEHLGFSRIWDLERYFNDKQWLQVLWIDSCNNIQGNISDSIIPSNTKREYVNLDNLKIFESKTLFRFKRGEL